MTTKEFVSTVKLRAPRWARGPGVNSILFVTDQVQRGLMAKYCKQTRYADPLTGWPPYLVTDGSLEYSVTDVTVTLNGADYTARWWLVHRVFIDITNFKDYDRKWLGESFEYYPANPITSSTEKLKFAPVRVLTKMAGQGTKAKVTFMEDPGTTTDKYYLDGVLEPVKLISELIPLTLPEAYHLEVLLPGVVGAIQKLDTGKSDEWDDFVENIRPAFWGDMNAGEDGDVPLTPPRL